MRQPPSIDISRLVDDAGALAMLDEACRVWGFFHIVGHGVGEDLQAALLVQARTFFALQTAEKRRLLRSDTNVWGFYDEELTKNTRDWKEIFDVGPPEPHGPMAGAKPQWPAAIPAFCETLESFMAACREVAHRLVAGIGVNLGVPADYLGRAFLPRDSSFLRLNYYPICDDPAAPDASMPPSAGHLGINHHTDAGALTVLLQDAEAGLQVHVDDEWCLIEPRAGALLVNIGDIVQVWSNDRYRAPLHRVIASSKTPRYSAPFFFNPSYATDYAPLASVCNAADAPRYRSINWGEFRAARAAGDYADFGSEVQISDFGIT